VKGRERKIPFTGRGLTATADFFGFASHSWYKATQTRTFRNSRMNRGFYTIMAAQFFVTGRQRAVFRRDCAADIDECAIADAVAETVVRAVLRIAARRLSALSLTPWLKGQ
jgi:hypothetical protein